MFGDENIPKYKLEELIRDGYITYHLDGNHGELYPRANEFVDSGIPYIAANCIFDNNINFDKAKFLTEKRASKFRKGIAVNGDVLFAHNATVGPVALLKTTYPKVILSTTLTSYRCNKKYINPYYLEYYMLSFKFIRQYSGIMKQSTRNQLPILKQRKLYFDLPDINEQNKFASFVELIDKQKFLFESIQYQRLKYNLIEKLFVK